MFYNFVVFINISDGVMSKILKSRLVFTIILLPKTLSFIDEWND